MVTESSTSPAADTSSSAATATSSCATAAETLGTQQLCEIESIERVSTKLWGRERDANVRIDEILETGFKRRHLRVLMEEKKDEAMVAAAVVAMVVGGGGLECFEAGTSQLSWLRRERKTDNGGSWLGWCGRIASSEMAEICEIRWV